MQSMLVFSCKGLSVNYRHRTLETEIRKASERFKAVMVSGMRQVGKSTMLKNLCAETRTYVTLDDIRAAELAENARGEFFKRYPAPILVDEIHRVPELCLEVKVLADSSDKRGKVWLTGSQRFAMMTNVSESLAGRLACFELMPMSLYERQDKAFEQRPYLPAGDLKRGALVPQTPKETWRAIWQGGCPEVIDATSKKRNVFFQSLLWTHIERDVVRTGIRNLPGYQRFLMILASRIGREFQLNAVAAEVGVAVQTVKQWLSVAESFFENFVIIELLKSWVHNGEQPHFYFYRDTRFNEIDLLIFDGVEYHPVEIKTTESPQASMVKAFDNIKGGHVKRGSGALICLTKEPRYLTSDVVAHSIWDI